MDGKLEQELQESAEEWANIKKMEAERVKKDNKIISMFCAENHPADIYTTIQLLLKYNGMPTHDKETVEEFNKKYPGDLNIDLLHRYLDLKDIYHEYLELGGECDD